jgi:hypothetical protein
VKSKLDEFFSKYDDQVWHSTLKLRKILIKNLPDIIEQVDLPARIIAYCYEQKYSDLLCTSIPSKKGLKLGFNWGTELQDLHKLLQGKGKISRYVEIESEEQIDSDAIKKLVRNVLIIYKAKSSTINITTMEQKKQLKHPAGKKAISMDMEKYELLKKAVLNCLKEEGELTHKEMFEAIAKSFKKNRTKFAGSVEWHMEWVKLDLEARKEIKRVADSSPIKFKIA